MTDQKIVCVYHADCADGFAAAWAVHRRFGAGNVDFIAGRYSKEPELSVPCKYHSTSGPCTDCLGTGYDQDGGPFLGRDVLIVDFSYPRATLEALTREARSVLVLDHHATAQGELAGLPFPLHRIAAADPLWHECWHSHVLSISVDGGRDVPQPQINLAAIFDMKRSGAGVTWDYLHPGEPRPRLIDLVEDRDLWRFKYDPETRQFHAVAASYGYSVTEEIAETGHLNALELWGDFDGWSELEPDSGNSSPDWVSLLNEGAAILRYEAKLVEGILRATSLTGEKTPDGIPYRRMMTIGGYHCPVANVPASLASAAGARLYAEMPPYTLEEVEGAGMKIFAATYYDEADGKRHFSLRSPAGIGADVSEIAREVGARFGRPGGGHKHAAGFTAPLGWEGE